jgi:hypothetical protein
MGKKHGHGDRPDGSAVLTVEPARIPEQAAPKAKLTEKEYRRELRRLHGELVAMQGRARLNVITHLLGQVPYEPLPRRTVVLPKRKVDRADAATDVPLHRIPTPF